jgi:hypothetical protein
MPPMKRVFAAWIFARAACPRDSRVSMPARLDAAHRLTLSMPARRAAAAPARRAMPRGAPRVQA